MVETGCPSDYRDRRRVDHWFYGGGEHAVGAQREDAPGKLPPLPEGFASAVECPRSRSSCRDSLLRAADVAEEVPGEVALQAESRGSDFSTAGSEERMLPDRSRAEAAGRAYGTETDLAR